jgi:hypothetical protein
MGAARRRCRSPTGRLCGCGCSRRCSLFITRTLWRRKEADARRKARVGDEEHLGGVRGDIVSCAPDKGIITHHNRLFGRDAIVRALVYLHPLGELITHRGGDLC